MNSGGAHVSTSCYLNSDPLYIEEIYRKRETEIKAEKKSGREKESERDNDKQRQRDRDKF